MKRIWLITARLEKGLSQEKAAYEIGMATPSYCQIENGKSLPKVKTAKKIANVLGVDWTKFYEEDV